MIRVDWQSANASNWQGYYNTREGAAFQQHYAYGEVIKAAGGICERAFVYEGDAVIALAQVTGRKRLGMITIALALRGPVWLAEVDDATKQAAYRGLADTCPIRKPRIVLWMPEEAGGLSNRSCVISPYHTVMWNLKPELGALEAALNGKWRNRLRRAEEAVTVKDISTSGDIDWLLQAEADQSARIGYSGISPQLIPAWRHQTGNKGLLVLAAYYKKERVGGVVCLLHGQTATYQIGWSSETGKQHNAHNLLLWQATKRLKARGITMFDLGGVNTDDAAGIARFKIGTGGQVVSLPGTFY